MAALEVKVLNWLKYMLFIRCTSQPQRHMGSFHLLHNVTADPNDCSSFANPNHLYLTALQLIIEFYKSFYVLSTNGTRH